MENKPQIDLRKNELLAVLILAELKRYKYKHPSIVSPYPSNTLFHLKLWLYTHIDYPYPSQKEKWKLVKDTGLSFDQVCNWFSNARRRILKDKKYKYKRKRF